MQDDYPRVIDAEFTVVGEPPKPWWRRLRLTPHWWVILALVLIQAMAAASGGR